MAGQKTGIPDNIPALAGEWELTHFEQAAVPSDAGITIQFDDDERRVSGHAGCNRFFGRYVTGIEEGSIQFGELAVTRMNCGPEVMGLEQGLLLAFTQVTRYIVTEGGLQLLQGDNILLMARRRGSS